MFIILFFSLGNDKFRDFFFACCTCFHIFTPLFLPSSISLYYFILAVPMRECLVKHSCMSSTFPIAILNGTCFFPDSATMLTQREFDARW